MILRICDNLVTLIQFNQKLFKISKNKNKYLLNRNHSFIRLGIEEQFNISNQKLNNFIFELY